MASEYEPEPDGFEAYPSLEAAPLTVEGVTIGGSYGAEESLDYFPDPQARSYASAMPTPRKGYVPERDLPVEPIERKATEKISAATMRPDYTYNKTGGGGNGGGVAKKMKPPKSMAAKRPIDDVERSIARLHVTGLSRGEVEFYHGHPGLARVVLADFVVGHIRRSTSDANHLPATSKVSAKTSFEVYGLSETQVRIIQFRVGVARNVLGEYAQAHDATRIALRDGLPSIVVY